MPQGNVLAKNAPKTIKLFLICVQKKNFGAVSRLIVLMELLLLCYDDEKEVV